MSTGFYSSSIQPDRKSRWHPVLALATAWSIHQDADDKPYYFNVKTGLSTYIKPVDKDEKAFAARPIGDSNSPWLIVYTNKKHYFFYNKETDWKGWFPPEDLLRKVIWQMSEEERKELLDPRKIILEKEELEEEEDLEEKDDVEEDDGQEDDDVEELEKEIEEKDNVIHDEVGEHENSNNEDDITDEDEYNEPAQKRAKIFESIPVEERVEIFKDLLRELNVSPFGQWSQEQGKIVSDPRFSILATEKERLNAFNSYCKIRSQELKQQNHQQSRAASDSFEEFLVQNVTSKTLWPELMRKVKRQFTGKLDIRTCEKRFKQYVSELKTGVVKEHEKKKENVVDDFISLLQETKEINVRSLWRDIIPIIENDPRYIAIASSMQREDIFQDFVMSLI